MFFVFVLQILTSPRGIDEQVKSCEKLSDKIVEIFNKLEINAKGDIYCVIILLYLISYSFGVH